LGSFYVVVYFVTDACLLCCVLIFGFSFSVLSQEVGWEERLSNDLLTRSISKLAIS